MITKTDYYPSRALAEAFYETRGVPNAIRRVTHLLDHNEIHIGKPPVRTGQRVVTVDGGLRYAIYTEGK